MITTVYKTFMRTLLWLAGLTCAKLCKMSFIVGSMTAFFSASALVAPLIGAFNSTRRCIGIFALCFCMQTAFFGLPSAHYLAYHIPGFCAALYWSSRSAVIGVLLPLVCIGLFLLNPIGLMSAPYVLFWLIPIVLYWQKDTIFYVALSSTFIAHAVGSVIWLYTVPTTSALWLSLIPIVIIERLAFASGMLLIVKITQSVRGHTIARFRYSVVARHN